MGLLVQLSGGSLLSALTLLVLPSAATDGAAQPVPPAAACYQADRTLGGGAADLAASRFPAEARFQLLPAGRVDRPGAVHRERWARGSQWWQAGDTLHVLLASGTSSWHLVLTPARRGARADWRGAAEYGSDAIGMDSSGAPLPPYRARVRVWREACAPEQAG